MNFVEYQDCQLKNSTIVYLNLIYVFTMWNWKGEECKYNNYNVECTKDIVYR